MSIFNNIMNAIQGAKWAGSNNWSNPDDPYSPDNGDILREAGLAVLGGASPAEGIEHATKMKQFRQQQNLLRDFSKISASIDPRDPYKALGQLLNSGFSPEVANVLIKNKIDSQQENRLQQGQDMTAAILGVATPGSTASAAASAPAAAHGGALNPNAAMKVGLLTGNKDWMTYGKELQDQEDRKVDLERSDTKEGFSNERSLREEFTQNTKDARETLNKYAQIKKLATVSNTASDNGLINMYARLLSPGIVTDNDFQQSIKIGGPAEQAGAYWEALKGNGRLTEEQRQEIIGASKAIATDSANKYAAQSQYYTGLAPQYKLDAKKVIGNFGYDDLVKELTAGGDQNNRPQVSQSDIDYTAKKYNMTPEQVRVRLGLQ